ncbi:MAG: hypothetical protein COB02_09830 [Candidatus Cloacimonadota bacterium]|nr:MAG: hypothetical protein COB02_09830 [Candidatus Cloacimonadota bacterium]
MDSRYKKIHDIKVCCPKCDKFTVVDISLIHTLKKFYSMNFDCNLCGHWIKVDLFVGNSEFNTSTIQSD